jgi:LacI family gluconate utilization system Gnt-I transcriptional repressor
VHLNDSGRNGGGDRPVRVEDVAREAGVSPITVSRALSSPQKLKPETLERVMTAVAKTGYVVNPIASSLRSGRSSIVMVFVASLRNPIFANAIQGTMEAFEGSRFKLMFSQVGYSGELRSDIVETVIPFRPAAVMFTGVVEDPELRRAVKSLNVPVMEMWGGPQAPIDMLVGSSTYEAGRVMGRHFGMQGFRRIAHFGHTVGRGADRLRGFRDGLSEYGRTIDRLVPMEGTSSLSDGSSAFDAILDTMPDCDAIFCGTDLLAVGALIAANRRGIAVPERVALAGFGDLDFASQIDPGITSVDVSDHEMGRRAGEMLRDRLEGAATVEPVIHLPVTLKVRASTGAKNENSGP